MQLLVFVSVAVGGALGALSRYHLSAWILSRSVGLFPYGTFTVNILGCFFIGLLYPLGDNLSPQSRVFLSSGFLGAFTTFSTFSLETIELFMSEQPIIGFCYVGSSLLLGLIAVFFGIKLGNLLPVN